MKRKGFLLFLLAALMLLASCSRTKVRFTVSEDGYRFTDRETGVVYTALSPAFEPAKGGNERGRCFSGETELTLREIPKLSPDVWLADDEKTLYFAGDPLPDPAAWTVSAVIFCEEDAISIERSRLTRAENGEALSVFVSAWFTGEETELSPAAPTFFRTAKLVFAEVPNIYYCISYYRYEDGSAALYERFSGRAVMLPEGADALFEVI